MAKCFNEAIILSKHMKQMFSHPSKFFLLLFFMGLYSMKKNSARRIKKKVSYKKLARFLAAARVCHTKHVHTPPFR